MEVKKQVEEKADQEGRKPGGGGGGGVKVRDSTQYTPPFLFNVTSFLGTQGHNTTRDAQASTGSDR